MRSLSFLIFVISLLSCQDKNNARHLNRQYGNPVKAPESLTSDYRTWWGYHYNNINLSADFLPIDQDGNKISKKEFLELFATVKYIVVELDKPGTLTYQLFEVPENGSKDLVTTIRNSANTRLHHFNLESTAFPDFEAVTIAGDTMNNQSFLGKTTVVKS